MTVASKKWHRISRVWDTCTHCTGRLTSFVFTLRIYLFCAYASRQETWQLHFLNTERKIYHSSYQWLGESSNVVTQNSELWYFELIDSDFNSSLQASLLSFWQCLVNLTTNPLTPDSRLVRSSPPSCWNRIASKKGRNCPRPCTTTGNISWSSKTDVP